MHNFFIASPPVIDYGIKGNHDRKSSYEYLIWVKHNFIFYRKTQFLVDNNRSSLYNASRFKNLKGVEMLILSYKMYENIL